MSEGELINSKIAIDNRDIFEKGYGSFSSKSINEIFDVNGDGYTDGVEKDLSSAGALNTLNSISPIVAHAFTNENFRIQTGAYLTEGQKQIKNSLLLAINKAMLVEKLKEIPIKNINPEEPNIDNGELNTQTLAEDIERRQYLSGAELNNNV